MDESRIELMKLLYKAYDAMLDERSASFDDELETEETRRMQADSALKKLFQCLNKFYGHGPGG